MKFLKKLLKPEIVLLLLLFALPLERIPSYDVAGITIRIPLILAGWLIVLTGYRFRTKLLPKDGLEKILWLFLFINFLSALASIHLGRSLEVVGFTIFTALLGICVARLVKPVELQRMEEWLVVGAIFACLFAFYQFLGDLFGLLPRYTGLRADYTGKIFGFPRVQSTALEPLFFANYLILPLSILFSMSLTRRRLRMIVVVMILACIFLTVSRGGAVAALITTVVFTLIGLARRLFKNSLKITAACLAGFLIALAMITTLVPYWGKLSSSFTAKKQTQAASNYKEHAINYSEVGNSMSDRARLRGIATEVFKENPLIGAGPGNFGYFANQQGGYPTNQTVSNLPLELLAETGLVGVIVLALFFAALVWRVMKVIFNKQTVANQRAWLLGLLVFLVATFVQYQTFSTLYIMHIWVAIGLLMGLTGASDAKKPVQ